MRDACQLSTTSIHATPPPMHYLVFDIDLPDQMGDDKKDVYYPCIMDETRGSARHEKTRVCVECWQRLTRAALCVLDTLVVETLELDPGRAPLYVFSGSKGMHVWYRLDRMRDPVDKAAQWYTTANGGAARRLFVEHWLSVAHQKRHPVLATHVATQHAWVTLDAKHTWDVFASRDKMPTRMKMPHSIHDTSSRVATVLVRDATTGIIELPWHLRAEATRVPWADELTRSLKLFETWLA